MAFPQGIYFRAADDQVDPTNYDAEIGTTANYPRTTAQGNTVGWEAAPGGTRDRITTGDVRLRGIHFGAQTGSQKYRIDLPAAGNYNIRVAFGDASSPHAARIRIVDSTTVLVDHASASVNAAEFRDATGVIRTNEVDWVANNAAYAATFASAIFRLDPTGGSTAVDPNWAVAALYIESAGAPAGATYNVSIAETASAVDTLSAILAAIASVAEAGAALDASSAALIGTASVAEVGSAAESQSATAVLTATRSDTLAAADTTSTGGAVTSAAVVETATATDNTSAIAAFLASVAEIGAALDSQSATAVLNAAWSDALNAADSQNWGGSVISVSLSEALNALDSQAASTVFAASVSESSAALDATSCVLIANASISEVLAALDSSSVQLITSAGIAEALSALDSTSVANLDFIAAQSHILVGRERVTVLVGKSRVLILY